MSLTGAKPRWLTFDCYGTLIQWDEGLLAAMETILAGKGEARYGVGAGHVDRDAFIAVYDRHEHRLEQERPHRSFADVTSQALKLAMDEFGLVFHPSDAQLLTGSIGRMPPFPEVVSTLQRFKQAGFRLAVISNTDDGIIAGNIAQLGGVIDRVITAEQALAYKPSPAIFRHAWSVLGVDPGDLVHICASPHLDLAAARDWGSGLSG